MANAAEKSEPNVVELVKECPAGRCFTAETFLEYLCPSHDRWKPTSEDRDPSNYGLPHGTAWIFRGMSNASWKLVPSLWRECNDRVLGLVELEQENDSVEERLRAYKSVYKRLRDEFKIRADLVGLLPVGGCDCEDEIDIFDQITPLDGLAQHHHIPTHLLDWTLNPLVAAFFAAEKADDASNVCVYGYNITRWLKQIPCDSFKSGKNPRVHSRTAPYSSSLYLRSQAGLFTHMPESGDYFKEHAHWPDLETALVIWLKDPINAPNKESENTHEFVVLRKIILGSSEKSRLLELLRSRGITRSHLMPTLDNVGQEVMADANRIISSK